jgi:hypothetical protein
MKLADFLPPNAVAFVEEVEVLNPSLYKECFGNKERKDTPEQFTLYASRLWLLVEATAKKHDVLARSNVGIITYVSLLAVVSTDLEQQMIKFLSAD